MIRAAILLVGLAACAAAIAAPRGGGFPRDYWGRWGGSHEGCSPDAVHGGITIAQLSVRQTRRQDGRSARAPAGPAESRTDLLLISLSSQRQ